MDSVVEICFGIVIVGVGLGFLAGYTLVAMGIADALGPVLGFIAFITIFPIFVIAPLGIGTNPKITLGFQFIFWSIAVALAFAGIISLLGKL